jgi:rhamnose transport system permease protein
VSASASSSHGGDAMRRVTALLGRWEILLLLLLASLGWIGSRLSPYFLSATNFSVLVGNQMEMAIMTLPMTLIIIVGEIDLSVESMLGLSSAILGALWNAGLPLPAGIAVVLAVGAMGGLLNGLLVTRAGLPSLVVTLGTLALYRGLAYVVLGPQSVSNFPAAFTAFGFGTVPGTLVPWPAVVFACLLAGCAFVLHGTWVGRQLYAIGNNREAARFAGIPTTRVKALLFVCSGVVAALAGVILTGRLSSARADNGQGLVLDVVTAVLLGGVNIFGGEGTVIGVVLAVLVVALLRNSFSLADVSSETQSIAIGLLLILSVAGPNAVRRIRRRRAGPLGHKAAGESTALGSE